MNEIQQQFAKRVSDAQLQITKHLAQGRGSNLDELRFLQGQYFGLEQAIALHKLVLKAVYEDEQ